ncbi:RING-H2 finger protein ATL67-like [Zingiber officinale]|uniref:RING-H2 finger protein ATL67-like n=1 Tax=Zingiber officinale TaxID=94328 RepID=UPI001C4D096B|nr:RING-H2 finger protein ATL67-like [Zingiber officinale]XP_042408256.1 RING-H2 finger protein ATL67-like [Zingiber officinale]XP_042408257.1 RING-H2 finger protein ATL67-like [Zingiber officinale]
MSTSAAASSSSLFSSLTLPLVVALSLLLLSAILLASCLCLRSRHRNIPNPRPLPPSSDSLVLPRIIFVAEDDDDDGGNNDGGRASGLEQAVISSYPKFPFAAAKGGDPVCSICLCEYREGEMLRMLPDCRHYFHLICVDVWLRLNASCPVCRTSPLPTPVSTPISTPLSELVPFSQFAADRRRT